jgi:hypothetical protein
MEMIKDYYFVEHNTEKNAELHMSSIMWAPCYNALLGKGHFKFVN